MSQNTPYYSRLPAPTAKFGSIPLVFTLYWGHLLSKKLSPLFSLSFLFFSFLPFFPFPSFSTFSFFPSSLFFFLNFPHPSLSKAMMRHIVGKRKPFYFGWSICLTVGMRIIGQCRGDCAHMRCLHLHIFPESSLKKGKHLRIESTRMSSVNSLKMCQNIGQQLESGTLLTKGKREQNLHRRLWERTFSKGGIGCLRRK